MKTVSVLTPENVSAALIASKQNGTRRAELILTTSVGQIICHGARSITDPAVGIPLIWLLDNNRAEYLMDPAVDTIQYDDGTP